MGSGGYDDTTFRPGPNSSSGISLGSGISFGGVPNGASELARACPILTFQTPLNSVDPVVLATLSVGDVLQIEERNEVVLALTDKGETVGSVTAVELSTLLACLTAGYGYVGQIESINGGTCIVTIKHKKK